MRFWKRKKLCKKCGVNISVKNEYCDRCREDLHKELVEIIKQKLMIAAREFKWPRGVKR